MSIFFDMGMMGKYYKRERKKYNEAQTVFGIPSLQERALMEEQFRAVQQSLEDRRATRKLILGQMGLKISSDGKSIVPLTKEERIAMMSEADRSRSGARQAYTERAKAALTGTTKLPSFLKVDVDYQKVKEEALLEEMLGPEAMQSTAGRQAVEAMKQKESDLRQSIQEQDLAMAPGAALGIGEQMEAQRSGLIRGYEALPNQQAGLIEARGSLLGQLQQVRLSELNRRLAELEDKRMRIQNLFTLGGTVGGAATAMANKRMEKKIPEANKSSYSAYQYQPLSEPSMSYYGWQR